MDPTQKDPSATGAADGLAPGVAPGAGDDDKSFRPPVATDLNEDIDELKTKIAALVRDSYGGDYKRAFAHYDPDQDGIAAEELKQLLEDAEIGNLFTRSSWVSGIIARVDANQDGRIAWAEFERIIKGG